MKQDLDALIRLAHRRAARGSGSMRLPADLLLTTVREHGLRFETGVPVKMPFYRNTKSSRRHGVALQRGGLDLGLSVEPAGRYMIHRSSSYRDMPNMETGTVRFSSPLVLEHVSTGSTGWKGRLSAAFGGKRGKTLSRAIVKAGYDGIVTVDRYSRDLSVRYTSEIVDLTFLVPAGSKARKQIRRRGFRYARRGSLAKLVDAPELLYHGTSARNLVGIFGDGKLVPGKGISPHRTKTSSAVFFTREPINAIMYGSAFGNDGDFVVFEVATRGLDVLPDYDDVGDSMDDDLEQLRDELVRQGEDWKPEIGARIPDGLEGEVEGFIDSLNEWSDREPTALSVEWVDGVSWLYAAPYLCQQIADDVMRSALDYDFYEFIDDPIGDGVDVSYDDGRPCITTLQYMVMGAISLKRVKRVFVSKRWFETMGVPITRRSRQLVVENPGYIRTPMGEDGYAMSVDEAVEAGLEDQVGFSKHTMIETTVPDLRAALCKAGSRARGRRR